MTDERKFETFELSHDVDISSANTGSETPNTRFRHTHFGKQEPATAPANVHIPLLMDHNAAGATLLSRPRRASDERLNNRQDNIGKNSKTTRQASTKRAENVFATATRELKHNVADWFGVAKQSEEERLIGQQQFSHRAQRTLAHNRIFGGFKLIPPRSDTYDSVFEPASSAAGIVVQPIMQPSPLLGRTPQIHDPLARGHRPLASRQVSGVSTASSRRSIWTQQPTLRRPEKESVIKIAARGVKHFVAGKTEPKAPSMHSRSITPLQIRRIEETQTLAQSAGSVFQSDESSLDDVFYDNPAPTSPAVNAASQSHPLHLYIPPRLILATPTPEVFESEVDAEPISSTKSYLGVLPIIPADKRPSKAGWQAGREPPGPGPGGDTPLPVQVGDGMTRPFSSMSRIDPATVDEVVGGREGKKRQIGRVAQFFTDATYRMSRVDSTVLGQMEELDEHRPFFTYWVTFVQIVCFIIALVVYGISTVGFSDTTVDSQVVMSNMAIEQVSYTEIDNMWIGPRQADMIHYGAKYSPCMRKDENVVHAVAQDRELEKHTACCILNDGGGCVQRDRKSCSPTLSSFLSWEGGTGPDGRSSGSVCGQDPRFCRNPSSVAPYEWPDDITQWPACKETMPFFMEGSGNTRHMSCDITGRPCCIGIQGQCIITTRDHCTFLRGYFHQDLTLCSQVSCMNEICGMTPFVDPDIPDQFYRLFISLFIHGGAFHLLLTIVFQIFVMSDIEKLAGSLRIAIIYIWSGVAGSLASAIFLPYHVEAGPSGSQFGLIACVFVEIIQNWYILARPGLALAKLGLIILILFAVGLLPIIDNYAHLIGFLFGFLLSFAFLPYITFNVVDKRGKLIGIIVCLTAAVGLSAGLVILFYVTPVYSCPSCEYFNCIPLTAKFCRTMAVKIERTT